MASKRTRSSSTSNGKLLASKSPPPSLSSPENTLQTTPSPDLSMRVKPRESPYLSPEFRVQYDQVFLNEIPQNPHFNPLSNICEETKQALVLGLNVSYLSLVQELRESADPSVFLAQLNTYEKQLDGFETMGYEVSVLRQRLSVMKIKAHHDRQIKDTVAELQEEQTEKEGKAKIQESRLKQLEEDVKTARKLLESQKSDIESIDRQKRKYMEDGAENVNEFKRTANSPWFE